MSRKVIDTVVLGIAFVIALCLSWYFGHAAFMLMPVVCKYVAGFAMIGLCIAFFHNSLRIAAKAANLWLKKSSK